MLAITQSSKSQATKTLITGLIQSVFFLKTHSHFVLMKSFFWDKLPQMSEELMIIFFEAIIPYAKGAFISSQ